MNPLMCLAALGILVSTSACIHTRQTQSQEDAAGKKTEATPTAVSEPKPTSKPGPVRTETLEPSKTTKQMFKPEGLKKLQVALSAKSMSVDETGNLDAKTQESLRAFQKDKGMPPTGLPDYETLRKLGLTPDEVFQKDTPGERNGVQ